jgi:hypothetical protein
MEEMRFPIGGPRLPVYEFLAHRGWIQSNWSDKHYTRADGLHLLLYGSGSMADIRDSSGKKIIDAPLEKAVAHVTKQPA